MANLKYNAQNYWNLRYNGTLIRDDGNTSGYGSYGEQLDKKLKWLSDLPIKSISEIGCGDFNFGKNLLKLYPVPYVGQDVSDIVIAKNQIAYPEARFVLDINDLPPADLLLCIDVFFHVLDDNDYKQLLKDIKSKWTKYLAITAYEYDQKTEISPHIRHRKFDYKQFGKPLIRKVVETDGSLMFYLFKK